MKGSLSSNTAVCIGNEVTTYIVSLDWRTLCQNSFNVPSLRNFSSFVDRVVVFPPFDHASAEPKLRQVLETYGERSKWRTAKMMCAGSCNSARNFAASRSIKSAEDFEQPQRFQHINIPAPVITLSLLQRLRSRQEESFGDKVLAALRQQFGGHAVRRA